MKNIILILSLALICLCLGCIKTETRDFNPSEKWYADINSHYNYGTEVLESKLKFYFSDSKEQRPFFLDGDVFLDGESIGQKFHQKKGLYYYINTYKKYKPNLKYTFKKLDGNKIDIQLPILTINPIDTLINIKKKDTQKIKKFLYNNKKIIILNHQNKMHVVENSNINNTLNNLSTGIYDAAIFYSKDTLYTIGQNEFIKYESEAISPFFSLEIIE